MYKRDFPPFMCFYPIKRNFGEFECLRNKEGSKSVTLYLLKLNFVPFAIIIKKIDIFKFVAIFDKRGKNRILVLLESHVTL